VKTGLLIRRTIAAAFLASVVDGVTTGGYYGGSVLDSFNQHSAANSYRFVGRIGQGLGHWVSWSAKSYYDDFRELSDRHGGP